MPLQKEPWSKTFISMGTAPQDTKQLAREKTWDLSGQKSLQLDDDWEQYAEPSLKGVAANIGLIDFLACLQTMVSFTC